MGLRFLVALLGLALSGPVKFACAQDVMLKGTISAEKLGTHELRRFTVPAGMERMEVELQSPGFAKGMYTTARHL